MWIALETIATSWAKYRLIAYSTVMVTMLVPLYLTLNQHSHWPTGPMQSTAKTHIKLAQFLQTPNPLKTSPNSVSSKWTNLEWISWEVITCKVIWQVRCSPRQSNPSCSFSRMLSHSNNCRICIHRTTFSAKGSLATRWAMPHLWMDSNLSNS